MRLLMVTHNFPPLEGGITTHAFEMARNWAEKSEIWVLAPYASGEESNASLARVKLVRMPQPRNKLSRLWLSVRWTLRLARKEKFDVIYGTHWRNCGIALRIVHALTGIPFVLAVHGSEVLYLLRPGHWTMRLLFRWVAAGSRGLVALGEYQRQLLEKLGIVGAKVLTSPEGIDLERLAKADADGPRRVRARHQLNGRRVIATVGRLVERKGHELIIRALPEVIREIPDVVYLIVGRGPTEAHLRTLAREMKVEDRVVFCGFVPDTELIAYYQACDVFAMPNREIAGDIEGFGIVFVEAAACGKPVIAGRSGGALEVVEDGVTGLLVDPWDVRDVARALIALLADGASAARMGQAGRSRVERNYNYGHVAGTILAFLQQASPGLCV